MGGWGDWEGVSDGGGGALKFENYLGKKYGQIKKIEILIFFTQKEHPTPQEMKLRHKKQKIVLPIVILEFGYPSPQLHQILKPIRELFCTTVTI